MRHSGNILLVVPLEAHNAILCEQLHTYLNKVQCIGAADSQSYKKKWAMNCLSAAYAWNRSPVDGTDIIQSFAAKASSIFHFHFDVQTADVSQEGKATIQYVETIEEQQTKHYEMANQGKKRWTFQPGGLVLV